MHTFLLVLSIFVADMDRTVNACKRKKVCKDGRTKLVTLPPVPLEEYATLYRNRYGRLKRVMTSRPPFLRPGHAKSSIQEMNPACGKRVQNIEAILEGQDAADKAWPWQALVESANHICGGALIDARWVITAAHCIHGGSTVILGRVDMNRMTTHLQVRQSSLTIVHDDYSKTQLFNDIALVKLNKPVAFTDYVRPICLPKRGYDFTNTETCYVSGWGKTDPKIHRLAGHVQELKVLLMSRHVCALLWGMDRLTITLGQICLQFNNTQRSAGICKGDSGGPLSCQINGVFYMAGIASLVEGGCRKENYPDIYTRTATYVDWINSRVEANS